MIVATFKPSPTAVAIEVELDDGREVEVMARACARIYPGPADPRREMEREAGYRAALAMRAKAGQ